MIGESGTGKLGGKYYYYTCVGKKRDKTCKKKPIKKDWIENLVIQETVRLILQDDMINEIADKVMEYQAREADHTILHSLQIQLNDTEKAIKNLIAAIEQGIITPSTKNRLEELEDEKIRIMNGIAEEDTIQPVVERDQILFYLKHFQNGDVSDPQYCQTLIDVFVNAVYVYDDRIVITYNYSGAHNSVTLEQIEQALGESEGSDTVSSAPC